MKNELLFDLLEEADFAQSMNDEIVPFLEKLRKTHSLTMQGGTQIYCETFEPLDTPLGLIVIFHGFCEYCSKFDELTYYMLKQGYAVCRFDQIGHGFSSREETRDLSKVHIKNFQTYVDCAYQVTKEIALPLAQERKIPLFLFSHSMGGAIAALFLEQNPAVFKAAVLSSPMLELGIPGLPLWLGKAFIRTVRFLGGKRAYIFGHGKFTGKSTLPEAEKNSTSNARFTYHYSKRKLDSRLQMWGGSFSWLDESLKAITKIFEPRNLTHIDLPILLFQAENDVTVFSGGQNVFADKVSSAKKLLCAGADHELYNAKNSILKNWYIELFRFFAAYSRRQESA